MTEQDFYKTLNSFTKFEEALNTNLYKPLPDSWYIVVSDIRNSTIAIENNKYKDVNIIGASCIIAVLNTLKTGEDIPFVFGGDGATFAIPEKLIAQTTEALLSTQDLAQNEFDLNLRIGIVPVKDILKSGKSINIAKYSISKNTNIAMFSGGGLTYADELIKNQEDKYSVTRSNKDPHNTQANFNGLECRWNPVKATKGQMITLLVQAKEEESSTNLYKDILNKIGEIYGGSECYQPNNQENMSLTFDSENHKKEIKVRSSSKNIFGKTAHILHIYGIVLIGTIALSFERYFRKAEKRNLTNDLIRNTDFQKFDDTLRMVIDSRPDQAKKLQTYLEKIYTNGKCVYGMHISDEALITCMIFDRADRHLHFIDGAQGGYALAAKKMKEQLKAEKDYLSNESRL